MQTFEVTPLGICPAVFVLCRCSALADFACSVAQILNAQFPWRLSAGVGPASQSPAIRHAS